MTIRGFKPIEITDAMVVESTLYETAPAAYAAGTTYALGVYVSVAGTLGEILIYKSLQASNTGNTPSSSPTWWEYSSSTYEVYDVAKNYSIAYRVTDPATHKVWESLSADNKGRPFDITANPPWIALGKTTRLTLPATYNAGTTYATDELVKIMTAISSDNGIDEPVVSEYVGVFKSKHAGNIGNTPPSNYGTNTHWEHVPTYPVPYSKYQTYGIGFVVRDTDANMYTSMITPNLNIPLISPVSWVEVGISNKYAPFDSETSTQAVTSKNLSFTINTGVCDAVALIGCEGAVATVTMRDGLGGTIVYQQTKGISGNIVAEWWAFLYGDATFPITKVLFEELPPFVNAHVTVDITGDGFVKLGTVDIGSMFELGIGAQYGASIEVKDYSVKTTDEFGKSTFIKRGFKELLDIQVMVDKSDFQRVYKTITDLRGTPWFIVVSDDIDWGEVLQLHGFYNSFRPVIEYPTASIYSLQFESLVTT